MDHVGHRDAARRIGRRSARTFAVALALGLARVATGQVAVATEEVSDEQQPPKPGGFAIKKEDPKLIEQLEDFERFRDKKAWDRAFKSLSAVLDAPVTGALAPGKDGFWIPTRQRLMQTLLTLPPEGREAYKLFNDAKAKQLYDQVLAHEAAGDADALPQLRKLVEQFSITGVGDKAIDRLGDTLMEAGDFAGAAQAYESVPLARPDTDIPALRLLAKRATALARAGRTEQFRTLAAQIREQHAGDTVKVGGKDVPVDSFLASLVTPTTRPATTAEAPAALIALPATTRPAWRQQFLDDALRDKITAQLNTNGWMGQQMGGMLSYNPAAATDGKRVYLNWYGTVWALDAATGKMLWWTSHFGPLAERVNEMAQWQVEQRRFTLTVVGDDVLTVAVKLDKLNQQEPFRLSLLDGATGRKKWSSETGALQNWAFIGQPLVQDGTVYAAVHPRNAQDVHLLAIDATGGAPRWEITLGQPQVGNNWRGMPVYPLPVLKVVGTTLYVMTNNGAVLAYDLASHQQLWAYTYDFAAPAPNENGMGVQQSPTDVVGTAFVREGTLYFKDQGGSAIHALDLAGPKALFRRPVDAEQMFVGLDDAGLYLVGPTFSFIRAAGRELAWAPRIPVTSGAMAAVRSGDDFFVFTSRGIYKVDAAARSIDIFRGVDLDSVGGNLLRAGDKLIAVSNLAVTAYDAGGLPAHERQP